MIYSSVVCCNAVTVLLADYIQNFLFEFVSGNTWKEEA